MAGRGDVGGMSEWLRGLGVSGRLGLRGELSGAQCSLIRRRVTEYLFEVCQDLTS